jgi:hypothetical protein
LRDLKPYDAGLRFRSTLSVRLNPVNYANRILQAEFTKKRSLNNRLQLLEQDILRTGTNCDFTQATIVHRLGLIRIAKTQIMTVQTISSSICLSPGHFKIEILDFGFRVLV